MLQPLTAMQPPSTWKDVLINVDLHSPAFVYLHMLDNAWKQLATSAAGGQSLSRLVYRYEQLWLPLLANWDPGDQLEPPDDVHWVWHLHLLRPDSYAGYCARRFGRVFPHRLRTLRPAQMEAVCQRTAAAWRQRYPDEPLDVPPAELWTTSTTSWSSPLVDTLTEIARREVDFAYQVVSRYRHERTSFTFFAPITF